MDLRWGEGGDGRSVNVSVLALSGRRKRKRRAVDICTIAGAS